MRLGDKRTADVSSRDHSVRGSVRRVNRPLRNDVPSGVPSISVTSSRSTGARLPPFLLKGRPFRNDVFWNAVPYNTGENALALSSKQHCVLTQQRTEDRYTSTFGSVCKQKFQFRDTPEPKTAAARLKTNPRGQISKPSQNPLEKDQTRVGGTDQITRETKAGRREFLMRPQHQRKRGMAGEKEEPKAQDDNGMCPVRCLWIASFCFCFFLDEVE